MNKIEKLNFDYKKCLSVNENGEELSCEYFESSVETTLFAMDILGYDTSDYYITNDGCMIEIGYDFPSSITKTEADDFVAKGMKSEVFEKLGTIHEENEKERSDSDAGRL